MTDITDDLKYLMAEDYLSTSDKFILHVAIDEFNKIEQQVAQLRAALEMYADEDNWITEAIAHDMETGEMPNADGVTPTVDVRLELGAPIVWCWDDEGYQFAQKALATEGGEEAPPRAGGSKRLA